MSEPTLRDLWGIWRDDGEVSERRECIGWVDYDWNVILDHNQSIVRCRDCVHFVRSEACPDYFDCKRTGLPTDDDMFCAWGERRDE